MVTHMHFDLCLFKHFSPVTTFGYQSLEYEIWADFGPVGTTEKIGPIMSHI